MATILVDTTTENFFTNCFFAQFFGSHALGARTMVPLLKQNPLQDLSGPMAQILVDTATEDFFTRIIFPRFF